MARAYATHPEDRERGQAALRKLRSGEAVRHREPLRLRHRDGRSIACQVHLAVTGDPRRGPIICQLVEAATAQSSVALTATRVGLDITEREATSTHFRR